MNVTFRITKTASNLSHSEGKVQQNHMLRLMANPKYSLEARKLCDHLKPFRLNPPTLPLSFCTTCVVLFVLVDFREDHSATTRYIPTCEAIHTITELCYNVR